MSTSLRPFLTRALLASAIYVVLVTLLAQLGRAGLPGSAVYALWVAVSLGLFVAMFLFGLAAGGSRSHHQASAFSIAVWFGVTVVATVIVLYVGYTVAINVYLLSGGPL